MFMGERVIGIDLGTTNSCVAIVDGGSPRVIPNKGGYKTTPSVVAVAENGRRLVGHIAKRQAITNAANTVYAAKRVIGRKWGHPAVESAKETFSYKLVEGPHGDVRIELRDRQYSVPEISAAVLSEMKSVAEEALGEPVEKAVITIPAYFNDGQRQATKDAGKIAGLDVIRMINEPTAAALAYGFGKNVDQKIIVFDLGGGTFDVSVLEIGQGVFEVICAAGDTYLGGEDFDQRIIEWLCFGFMKDHKIDLRQDRMALQRLKDAAETAKCELSTLESTTINLPFIISPQGSSEALHLQATLTRAKLEELTGDLVDRCIQITDQALRDAELKPSDIHEVVLVGGQTRMPLVQKRVEQFFKRPPCKGVHPDEVVALGAAVQGAALLTQEHGQKSDMLLLDVTPHNLGIMVAGGYAKTLIEANSTVPTSASHTFTTAKDNQTQVKIVILQGNSPKAEQNEVLGEFLLTGLREAARGVVEVDVTFDISADGIVSVSAKDKDTGKQQSIVVTASSSLTEEELKRIMADNKDLAVAARSKEEFEKARVDAERMLRDLDRLWPQAEAAFAGNALGQETLRKAKAAMDKAKGAIATGQAEAMPEVMEPLARTLSLIKGAVSKKV
ncbi:MAG: molecular chaperone DnaK [Myxococcota bacterium]